jgi:hypothetical protein
LKEENRVMGYTNDLFISYAHIDNVRLSSEEEGWVTNLHNFLEVRLAQLLGAKANIWRDPKLSGNDYFSDEICEQLPRVAALLAVLSPRYIRSEWCLRELNAFCEAAERTGGLSISNRSKLFKVIKTPIPRDQHPDQTVELLGYEFFVYDEAGRPRELGPASGHAFQQKADDLAQDISNILDLLHQRREEPAESSGEQITAQTVFLADTSFDLRPQWETIRRELQQLGHQVLPEQALPLRESELAESVRDLLCQCSLSIHLIGKGYGLIPEEATRSVIELQNQIAAECTARRRLQRLIWIAPDMKIEDERQQVFVDRVRYDPQEQLAADVLETSLDELRQEIREKLRPRQEPVAQAAADGSQLVRIYLICDHRDLDDVIPLEDHLYDQEYEVILPVFEGEPAQIRQDHEESLGRCDAVIVYWGAANELWVRGKLREIDKAGGWRSQPIRSRAIWVAGPIQRAKERWRTREAMVIKSIDQVSPELLAPFLQQLEQERTSQ